MPLTLFSCIILIIVVEILFASCNIQYLITNAVELQLATVGDNVRTPSPPTISMPDPQRSLWTAALATPVMSPSLSQRDTPVSPFNVLPERAAGHASSLPVGPIATPLRASESAVQVAYEDLADRDAAKHAMRHFSSLRDYAAVGPGYVSPASPDRSVALSPPATSPAHLSPPPSTAPPEPGLASATPYARNSFRRAVMYADSIGNRSPRRDRRPSAAASPASKTAGDASPKAARETLGVPESPSVFGVQAVSGMLEVVGPASVSSSSHGLHVASRIKSLQSPEAARTLERDPSDLFFNDAPLSLELFPVGTSAGSPIDDSINGPSRHRLASPHNPAHFSPPLSASVSLPFVTVPDIMVHPPRGGSVHLHHATSNGTDGLSALSLTSPLPVQPGVGDSEMHADVETSGLAVGRPTEPAMSSADSEGLLSPYSPGRDTGPTPVFSPPPVCPMTVQRPIIIDVDTEYFETTLV